MDFIERKKNQKTNLFIIGAFALIPFLFAIPPFCGWLLGQWLDQKFDTAPLCEFLFIGFGFTAGMREVYKIIRRYGYFS